MHLWCAIILQKYVGGSTLKNKLTASRRLLSHLRMDSMDINSQFNGSNSSLSRSSKNAAELLVFLGNGGKQRVAAEERDHAHYHQVLDCLEHVQLEPEEEV
jgi:hypothetical protein